MKQQDLYEWCVIGAGPAGICAVGKLLDCDIAPQKILWIDPYFKAGDLGMLWYAAPSNTKVKLFLAYLKACRAFQYDTMSNDFPLNHMDPEETCTLNLIAGPLCYVTQQLMQQVSTIKDWAHEIQFTQGAWKVTLSQSTIDSKNIILAIGAEPNVLNHPNVQPIALQDALNPERLQQQVHASDTVAVFGSSHSALLALMNLTHCPVKKIINIYRSPLRYALYFDDWILFDETGLKGGVAQWARENIDTGVQKNIFRLYASEENVKHHLPSCNKVIYAIGFERRQLPVIQPFDNKINYIPQCGIVAPGLFGFGIAFPEIKLNRIGIREYNVGLWKFMDYIERILPFWLRYSA